MNPTLTGPTDRPQPLQSDQQRSMMRWVLYACLSVLSGVGWAGIFLWLAAWGGGSSAITPLAAMSIGAATGTVVGGVMQYFYRRQAIGATVFSSPLALWLGMFCFLLLGSLGGAYGTHDASVSASIVAALYMSLVAMMFPPFSYLILLALINGLILRLVLLPDQRAG